MYDYIRRDIDINDTISTVYVVQGDSRSRKLVIRLTDNDNPNERVVHLAGCSIKALFVLPSGSAFYVDGDSDENAINGMQEGTVTITLPSSVTAEEGTVNCEIFITDTTNDTVLSLRPFEISVAKGLAVGGLSKLHTAVKTYSPLYAASYWASRNICDTDLLIQGSYTNTQARTRRSLIIFDNQQMRKDIGTSKIVSVKLRLMRVDDEHGISGQAPVYIKLHKYEALPDLWNGEDLGDADSSTPTISRGEAVWATLDNTALQKIINGEAGGFALDADDDYSLRSYVKFEKSAVQLEIQFSIS